MHLTVRQVRAVEHLAIIIQRQIQQIRPLRARGLRRHFSQRDAQPHLRAAAHGNVQREIRGHRLGVGVRRHRQLAHLRRAIRETAPRARRDFVRRIFLDKLAEKIRRRLQAHQRRVRVRRFHVHQRRARREPRPHTEFVRAVRVRDERGEIRRRLLETRAPHRRAPGHHLRLVDQRRISPRRILEDRLVVRLRADEISRAKKMIRNPPLRQRRVRVRRMLRDKFREQPQRRRLVARVKTHLRQRVVRLRAQTVRRKIPPPVRVIRQRRRPVLLQFKRARDGQLQLRLQRAARKLRRKFFKHRPRVRWRHEAFAIQQRAALPQFAVGKFWEQLGEHRARRRRVA